MSNRLFTMLCLGLFALLAVAPVSAEVIAIPNGDFESPVIDPAVFIYGQIYDAVDFPLLAPWQLWQGALTNPTTLGNLPYPGFSQYLIDMTGHGDQCGYLFCNDPDASNKPYWYQDLAATFDAGKEYTLSVSGAVIGGVATPGQTLEMRLGYWADGDTALTGPTIVAQRLIADTEISALWTDYSIASGAIPAEAAGKPIVVYFAQGDNPYVQGPQYYIDNVQMTAVPEPGTIAILASGILGLVIFARRKRS
jgi:hypothetical protein